MLRTALNYPRPKPPPDPPAPRRGRRSRRAPGWSQDLRGDPGVEGYIYATVLRLTPKRPRAGAGGGDGAQGDSVWVMQRAADGGESQSTGLVEAAGASSPGGTGLPAQDEWSTCSQLPRPPLGGSGGSLQNGGLNRQALGRPPLPDARYVRVEPQPGRVGKNTMVKKTARCR